MSDVWLPSLITSTPQEGYELAVKMSRVAVKMTQPDPEIRAELRSVYEHDANSLILASSVVATHFQTIAKANAYWKAS
ncbi:hexameric tyrosine-coordinated heme protein (HTHP) [Litoreibacter meonggei]|uniref:Hexameric tyrosine-coordinated heme protein (HTHP) n=1 Tax=Litoreibacter meonggei TaxID=1049199 RepID=A0A497VDE9_9RHOB|nr:hexameric tyrosine-coordinated heme protein [Litoreibacter meonggei]RLJ41322.1 hexameric tyrosine-coordinated heme protein (HTHP) [Litoreibacter meonggei]